MKQEEGGPIQKYIFELATNWDSWMLNPLGLP